MITIALEEYKAELLKKSINFQKSGILKKEFFYHINALSTG